MAGLQGFDVDAEDVNMTPQETEIQDQPAPPVNQDALPPNIGDITMDQLPHIMLPPSEPLLDQPAPAVPADWEPQIMPSAGVQGFPDRPAPAVAPQGHLHNIGSTSGSGQVPDFERRMVDALDQIMSGHITQLRQDFGRNPETNVGATGEYCHPSQTKPCRQVATIRKPYLHPGPQTKDALQNAKQRCIRRHVKSLLKPEDGTLPRPPSAQAVQDFQNGIHTNAPTLETFRIAYLEPPKCKWNAHCFTLFLDSFLQSDSAKLFETEEDQRLDSTDAATATLKKREEIYTYWVIHFYGIRLKYRNQLKEMDNPLLKSQRLSTSARDARRQVLFDRRLTICRSVEIFKPHIPILQQLGPAGMSSDESSRDDQGLKSYTVRKREWRAVAVKVFLRRLDEIYRQTRYTPDNARSGPGNEVHIRRDPPNHAHTSTRKPVPFLPKTLYDPQWFASHNPIELALLGPKDQIYDLAHRVSS